MKAAPAAVTIVVQVLVIGARIFDLFRVFVTGTV
jgi:hypothetical protein